MSVKALAINPAGTAIIPKLINMINVEKTFPPSVTGYMSP